MSNSVFGKTIEETRGRFHMVLVKDETSFMKYAADPCYESYRIINENLVACFLKHHKVKLNKPYATGFTILEKAKLQMYDQFYNVLVPHFKGDINILMSDTDSILAEVKTSNITRDFYMLRDHFDFSNYPPNHVLFNPIHKNQTGRWKDETKGLCEITRFVGLKAKTYAFETRNLTNHKSLKEKITSKGVNKGAQKQLHLTDYMKCLDEVAAIRANVISIRSNNFILSTTKMNKLALSSFDDKKWLYNCGIHTSPYGSCLIAPYTIYCPFCPNHHTFYSDNSNVVVIDVSNE
jgi:hypothetical protein